RHVMATHARHHRNVPPEVIAHFFLHHRLRELTGRTPSLSEISEYYTQMTEEQRLAAISADLDEQEELDHALLLTTPTLRDLSRKTRTSEQCMRSGMRSILLLWAIVDAPDSAQGAMRDLCVLVAPIMSKIQKDWGPPAVGERPMHSKQNSSRLKAMLSTHAKHASKCSCSTI